MAKESKNHKINSKPLKWVFLAMILVLVIIALIYVASWKTNHFSYMGFKWEKGKYGTMDIYTTNMAVVSQGGKEEFQLILRNDPRKLTSIPINANIKLNTENTTYISIDSALQECSGLSSSLVDMGRFLAGVNVKAAAASMNETVAKDKGYPYLTCYNKGDKHVITFEKARGENTTIEQNGEYCIRLVVANCEVRQAFERFMLGAIAYSTGQRI